MTGVDTGRGCAPTRHALAKILGAVLLVAAPLAACGDVTASTEADFDARQQAIDPPRLWLAEAVGDSGQIQGTAFVCADRLLRETFGRARAEVDGVDCRDVAPPVVKPGLFAVRCKAGGRQFSESIATTGDLTREFQQVFALTSLDQDAVKVRQARRFREVGACPAGWRIGDQARPGQRPR
jgi:hypothetical protein